ncbi:MAG: hypothetical protein L0241_06305, partial [Planctomycetia bacterium]|nr:hypothetical protein [Planctomycetia bacterium]
YAVDFKTGEKKYTLEGVGSESSVAFSSDGKVLALCASIVVKEGRPGVLPIWRYEVQLRVSQTGKLSASLNLGEEKPRSLAHAPDGRLAVGCDSGKLLFISADLKKIEATIQLKGEDKGWKHVHAVTFSPDGTQVAAVVAKTVSILDPKKVAVIRTLPEHPNHVNALAYSPDGKLLATGYGSEGGDGVEGACGVKVWDAATGDLKKDLK